MGDQELRIPDLIALKRDGDKLRPSHIRQFVQDMLDGKVHHAQLGAMLMAILLQGMNHEEVVELTKAMLDSGEKLQWPKHWEGLVVDKHSTGGVGDKVSLALAAALAACGMKVPMISGRGLSHTGGTLDKLESIPGYCTNLTPEEMKDALDTAGCCIVSQSKGLVPADRVMYSVRDITGTVPSLPLIVSSIISKKAAEGLNALVLDVKCGKGSFMKTKEDAEKLANVLVATSEGLGISTSALITEMDNPIGMAIGNSLEVLESIDCLLGKGPQDLKELVCSEGGELLFLCGKSSSRDEGHAQILKSLENGTALNLFKQMLIQHKVNEDVAERICSPSVHSSGLLPVSKNATQITTNDSGFVRSIDSLKCGEVAAYLGIGRFHPDQEVAKDVGLLLAVHPGMEVKKGDIWVTVFHREPSLNKALQEKLESAIEIVHEGSGLDVARSRILGYVSGKTSK